MAPAARVAAFAAFLVAVFAVAALAGNAIGVGDGSEEDDAHGGHAAAPAAPRLQVLTRTLEAGERQALDLRIVDAGGEPVRAFDVVHERRMHVILVRRDLTGFQHLHPRLADDGTWKTDVSVREGGTYRVFADFSTGGERHTLGADVGVAGASRSAPVPEVSDTATTGGYRVDLERDGDVMRFAVTRDGEPVDAEPYLGARGHLVVLREGDLEYLHVHPEDDDVAFRVDYPSAGRYRLFLQFRHAGAVHTATFTQAVAS